MLVGDAHDPARSDGIDGIDTAPDARILSLAGQLDVGGLGALLAQASLVIGHRGLGTQLAAAVGIRKIAGYLAGGMTSWREERRTTDAVARIDVATLHDRRDELQLLDVRGQAEFAHGHIAGSVHTPYHDIAGIPDGIDAARPVAVICASGQRAAIAASLLLRAGAEHVIHVTDGGVGTWRRAGF